MALVHLDWNTKWTLACSSVCCRLVDMWKKKNSDVTGYWSTHLKINKQCNKKTSKPSHGTQLPDKNSSKKKSTRSTAARAYYTPRAHKSATPAIRASAAALVGRSATQSSPTIMCCVRTSIRAWQNSCGFEQCQRSCGRLALDFTGHWPGVKISQFSEAEKKVSNACKGTFGASGWGDSEGAPCTLRQRCLDALVLAKVRENRKKSRCWSQRVTTLLPETRPSNRSCVVSADSHGWVHRGGEDPRGCCERSCRLALHRDLRLVASYRVHPHQDCEPPSRSWDWYTNR